MRLPLPPLLVWLLLHATPTLASVEFDAEARVREIERLNVTAHWRESQARVDTIRPNFPHLDPDQRARVELVALRNLGLSGEQIQALARVDTLLDTPLSPKNRLRALLLGSNFAINVGDFRKAFVWLNEGLSIVPDVEDRRGLIDLLGLASILYSDVGEHERALDYARRAMEIAETETSPRPLCLALEDMARAEEAAGLIELAESSRRRQVEACQIAGDPVFIASGKLGMAQTVLKLGRYSESLGWAEQALEQYQETGYATGIWIAKSMVAKSLIRLRRDLDQAEALIFEVLPRFTSQNEFRYLQDCEQELSDLAERRGDFQRANFHLKRSVEAFKRQEQQTRDRQMAYFQVELDTRLNEQRIAALEQEKRLAGAQIDASRRAQHAQAQSIAALTVVVVLLATLLWLSARDRRRYRTLSERDGLTGLYHHRELRERGRRALSRAESHGRPFTVVVIDIDRFRDINRVFGHAAGDAVLRALGVAIVETVAGHGIAGRCGDEEFAILLDTDAEGASRLIASLRQRIQPPLIDGRTITFDFSFGLARAEHGSYCLPTLIGQAEAMLGRTETRHDEHSSAVPETRPDPMAFGEARP